MMMIVLKNRIQLILLLNLIILLNIFIKPNQSISAYWTPILPKVCSSNVSKNITQALFACDKLMDQQLSNIFDDCVRMVHHLKDNRLIQQQPKLCYYLKMGLQLDRCKMARYQSEGITLPELVDREQDHTWCLMKIAQPLGWEKLCSEQVNDLNFLMANQNFIQNCEQRFIEITKPIRDCFREHVQRSTSLSSSSSSSTSSASSAVSSFLSNLGKTVTTKKFNNSNDRFKPAACLSFQYSRKIWKCLAEKDNQQIIQRRANLYISCLRSIRQQQQH